MAYVAKRKFKRSVRREAVKLTTTAGVEYATFEDLGAGGLKLWMERSMQPGTILELQFSLRSKEGAALQEIVTKGRVVRSAKTSRGDAFEIGIEFTKLDPATRTAIEGSIDAGEGPF